LQTFASREISRMRAVWGSLVTVGAVGIIVLIAGSVVSEYLDRYGTILPSSGREVNLTMATAGRIRSLIGQLQVR
jgi:hypothetical protein